MPLRERNALLLAADMRQCSRTGRSPIQRCKWREAVERAVAAHMPHPAPALDRGWTVLVANAAVSPLLAGADPALLAAPVNVPCLSLHLAGLALRIGNRSGAHTCWSNCGIRSR